MQRNLKRINLDCLTTLLYEHVYGQREDYYDLFTNNYIENNNIIPLRNINVDTTEMHNNPQKKCKLSHNYIKSSHDIELWTFTDVPINYHINIDKEIDEYY